jgi:hypothetical protein
VPRPDETTSHEDLAGMETDDLLELHGRLVQQQRWLEQRWRDAGGDAQVVVHLLRLWVEGSAVTQELQRRAETAG